MTETQENDAQENETQTLSVADVILFGIWKKEGRHFPLPLHLYCSQKTVLTHDSKPISHTIEKGNVITFSLQNASFRVSENKENLICDATKSIEEVKSEICLILKSKGFPLENLYSAIERNYFCSMKRPPFIDKNCLYPIERCDYVDTLKIDDDLCSLCGAGRRIYNEMPQFKERMIEFYRAALPLLMEQAEWEKGHKKQEFSSTYPVSREVLEAHLEMFVQWKKDLTRV